MNRVAGRRRARVRAFSLPLVAASLFFTACDDRRLPVGWWIPPAQPPSSGMGAAPGMTPPSGAGGAGGTVGPPGNPPSASPPAVGTCAIKPGPMPIRKLGISGVEVGARLGKLLWQTELDADTRMKAAAMDTSDEVGILAQQMLDDPRALAGMRTLARGWLRTPEALDAPADATVGMAVTQELRRSMIEETDLFVHDVVARGGLLHTLLTSNASFVDRSLGALYGVNGPPAGFIHVMFNPDQRAGVLTHASTLFTRGRATRRGVFLRRALLCEDVPPPPAGIDNELRPPPDGTYRQALNAKTAEPACAACHHVVDPLGFALEHYDPLGRHRTDDNGFPVDASGEIPGVEDLAGVRVKGARDLGNRLAGSCQVQRCVAETFYLHAIGRDGKLGDEAALGEVLAHFAQSNFSLRELLVAAVQTPAFISP